MVHVHSDPSLWLFTRVSLRKHLYRMTDAVDDTFSALDHVREPEKILLNLSRMIRGIHRDNVSILGDLNTNTLKQTRDFTDRLTQDRDRWLAGVNLELDLQSLNSIFSKFEIVLAEGEPSVDEKTVSNRIESFRTMIGSWSKRDIR